MSKLIKKSLKIVGIIIISILALLFILPFAFKGKIIKIAQEQANQNLKAIVAFDDISLSMFRSFPNLSIRVEKLSVAGVDTFKMDTLISFDYLELGVNLMSVISGDEINVKSIKLHKPNINAIVLANGQANWDITIEDTTVVVEEVDTLTNEEPSTFKINLKKFEITEAKILYDDKTMATTAFIENLNFKLKGDMTEDFTNLDIETFIEKLTVEYEGIKYFNKTSVEYKAEIAADLLNSKYTFKENSVTLNTLKLNFDGFIAMPDTNIVMDIKYNVDKNKFKSALSLVPAFYMTDFEGLKVDGNFGLNGYVQGFFNAVNMPAYGVDLFVEKGKIQYPDLPKSINNINIKMKVDAEEGTGDNIVIDISKAHFELAKNPMDILFYAYMTAADIDMKGSFKGKIDFTSLKDVMPADSMSIAGLLAIDMNFKGKMSDIDNEEYDKFHADGELKLKNFEYLAPDMPKFTISSSEMYFSPQFVNLKEFKANTPKSDFNLKGKIYNVFAYVFKDELLKAEFVFKSKYIDADEFMEEEEATAENTPETATATTSEPIKIPENIDFTLNSNINKLNYDSILIENIKGQIIIKDGIAKMNNVNMNLLGGSTSMSGSFNTQNEYKPLANFNLNFKNFDISELYKTFNTIETIAPIAKYCTGKIAGDISFTTVLDTELMPVYNTLDSYGYFSSNKIGIKNNKLFNTIADKTKYKEFKDPVLNDIYVAYIMEDGNLTIKPTKFKLAGVKSEFGGTQNIDGAINYDLDMELPASVASNVISKLPGNLPKTVLVKATIGGTLEDPKIVGFSSNLTDAIKDQIVDKIEEYTDLSREKAQEIIDNAQKQAQKIIDAAKKKSDIIIFNADKAGKKLVSEAKVQGNKLIKEAKNPIAKKAARIAADKLVKEANQKSQKLNKDAKKTADAVVKTAQTQADKIVSDAKKKAAAIQ